MRIKEIDGLRAIAIAAVFWHHYMSWVKYSGAVYGWAGVDMFFVISGFLITSILVDLKFSDKSYFKTFYARRAFRIFPAYYFILLLYLLFSLSVQKLPAFSLWIQYILYYSSLHFGQPNFHLYKISPTVMLGLGVLWSLSVEEIFYTLWAPLVRFINHRYFFIFLPSVILICPLLRWHFHTYEHAESFSFLFRMDALSIGALAALLYRERNDSVRLRSWDTIFDRSCVGFSVIAVAFLGWTSGSLAIRSVSSFGMSLVDLWFGLIIYAAVRHSGENAFWLRRLRSPTLSFFAKISYSLYLIHYSMLMIAKNLCSYLHLPKREDAILATLAGSVFSIVAAYAMWCFVESPPMKMKDKLFPSTAVDHIKSPRENQEFHMTSTTS